MHPVEELRGDIGALISWIDTVSLNPVEWRRYDPSCVGLREGRECRPFSTDGMRATLRTTRRSCRRAGKGVGGCYHGLRQDCSSQALVRVRDAHHARYQTRGVMKDIIDRVKDWAKVWVRRVQEVAIRRLKAMEPSGNISRTILGPFPQLDEAYELPLSTLPSIRHGRGVSSFRKVAILLVQCFPVL